MDCLMKRFFNSIMAFATIAAALVSCERNEIETQELNDGFRYTFTIVDDNTKATLDNNGVLWEANDRVGMFVDSYKGYAKVDVTTTPKSIVLYSTSAIPAGTMAYAYYPYNNTNTDKEVTLITLSNVQQGGANSAMPMAGVPFKVEEEVAAGNQEGNGQIKFLNLGAIIDFKIYSDQYDDETVQYVTFQADDAVVAGDAYLDLTAVNASDESSLELVWMSGENEFDAVRVNQEVPVAVSKAEAASIYMVVAPGTYSGTITVGTDVATYTFNYSNKELVRNVIKHYNMNLNNASRVEEVVEIEKTLPYEEAFTSNQGDFSIENVTLPEGQSSIWSFDASYGAKVTAYVNKKNYQSETWLVSPKIDLTNVSAAKITFEQCVNSYLAEGDATLWIKAEGASVYTQIANTYPALGSKGWSSFEEKTIDLSDYVGNKIVFAFKYISSSDAAGTWEIKNFKAEEIVYTTEFTIASESFKVQVGQTKNNPVSVNSGATITYFSEDETIATVDEEGNVTGVAEGETTIKVSVPAYNGYPAKEASYVVEVIPAETEKDFTWDLSKASYDSATESAVVWSNDNVTMQNAKGTSNTAPNNYIPTTRTSTRFYTGNILTITPKGTCEISKMEFTAASEGYASAFVGSTWTNANAVANGTTVTVTPIDGTKEISATVGGTCGFTAVKVFYFGGSAVVEEEYTITINETSNGTVSASAAKATKGTEISLTITPAEGFELDVLNVVDAEDNAITVTNNKFTMPESNVTISATFKVKEESGDATEYVLTPIKNAGNTAYAAVFDVTIDDVTWSAPGNQNFDGYWRIGGKSLTNEKRVIYGKTALPKNVDEIIISTNGVSNTNLTVNSITVTAHSSEDDAASGNNAIATYTTTDNFSFAASTAKSITFVKSDETDTANSFYRIVFTVSNSKSSNYGLDLTGITFSYN